MGSLLVLASKRPLANAISYAAAFSLVYAGLSLVVLVVAHSSEGAGMDPGRLAQQLWGTAFLLAGSQVGLVGPILWYVARPASAARGLGRIREWLARHEELVDLGVLVVFGLLFTFSGLRG
jgi:hypothetical protein